MFAVIVIMNYFNLQNNSSGMFSGVYGELETFVVLLSFAGFAVACVWIVLWLSGVWRAEPSWIDRTGRVLGIYWVSNCIIAVPLIFS